MGPKGRLAPETGRIGLFRAGLAFQPGNFLTGPLVGGSTTFSLEAKEGFEAPEEKAPAKSPLELDSAGKPGFPALGFRPNSGSPLGYRNYWQNPTGQGANLEGNPGRPRKPLNPFPALGGRYRRTTFGLGFLGPGRFTEFLGAIPIRRPVRKAAGRGIGSRGTMVLARWARFGPPG